MRGGPEGHRSSSGVPSGGRVLVLFSALMVVACASVPAGARATGGGHSWDGSVAPESMSPGAIGPTGDSATGSPSQSNPFSAGDGSQGGSRVSPHPTPAAPPTHGPSPAPQGVGTCPDPRSCPAYTIVQSYWPADSSGHIVVHYTVNPGPPQYTDLSTTQIVDIVRRGAATWMAVDPTIELIYDGTTTPAPEGFNNVVGFVPCPAACAGVANTQTSVAPGTDANDGFNIQLNTGYFWTWQACGPPGKPCDAYAHSDPGDSEQLVDLQQTMTHEWGPVVGLDDISDTQRDPLMTMFGGLLQGPDCGPLGPVCRFGDTLGLGDVLGVRKKYATSAAMPTLYDEQ